MKIYLAPMEGVVDHHMRYLLSHIGGIDLCVTEFIRVTDHILPRKVFLRYSPELILNNSPELILNNRPELNVENNPEHVQENNILKTLICSAGKPHGANCPTRIQLLGSNAQAIAENAYKAAQLGAPGIDLNFGCPAKTVNKNRGGACLLNEPNTLYDIVAETRKCVPQTIPVTAKIRLGYEERNRYLENARAISEAGASELVVHARSKTDGYKPPAYWECIAEIKQAIALPVIANGEIWSVEDYERCRHISGCEDVMLGRGLLATPDLALAIKAKCNNEEYQLKPWEEIVELLLQFFLMTSRAYPKKHMGNRLKQWLFYLQRQYPQALTLFNAIKRHRDYTIFSSALLAQLHCQRSIKHYQKLAAG